MRSAVAQSMGASLARKIEATWDPEDPVFTPRERAALEMASKFTDDYQSVTDEDLERWKVHFSDEELVELGYFVGVTFGQQSWIRTLDIGHHEVLDESSAGLAPDEVRAGASR